MAVCQHELNKVLYTTNLHSILKLLGQNVLSRLLEPLGHLARPDGGDVVAACVVGALVVVGCVVVGGGGRVVEDRSWHLTKYELPSTLLCSYPSQQRYWVTGRKRNPLLQT